MANSDFDDLEEQARVDGIQRLVVGAIINDQDDRILLLVRAGDEWLAGLTELPRGAMEENESISDGLRREIFEETGLEISEIRAYLGYFDYNEESGRTTRQLNFIVSVRQGAVMVGPAEHARFEWITPTSDNFVRLPVSSATRTIIVKAADFLAQEKRARGISKR